MVHSFFIVFSETIGFQQAQNQYILTYFILFLSVYNSYNNIDQAAKVHETAMKHQEELMKAEQQKNQQKDEASTKLMEAMRSGNKAAQAAAEAKLQQAAKAEEQTKAAAKAQVKAAQVATDMAIKAQEDARLREKEMEERKKKLETDLKAEHEKTTEVKIQLARAEAKAEAAEKSKEDYLKHLPNGDTDKTHALEVKVGHLEGQIIGMKAPCGSSSGCDEAGSNKDGSEDQIQTAVDAAVEKLINKTRERKTEDDAIDSIEEKNHEKEEVLKAERDTIVNEKMEVEKQKEEAETKAKDNDADLALMKAEHQKTKLENGKLKSDMLNLQQQLTSMGEEKMELNNRLSDLAVPAGR